MMKAPIIFSKRSIKIFIINWNALPIELLFITHFKYNLILINLRAFIIASEFFQAHPRLVMDQSLT